MSNDQLFDPFRKKWVQATPEERIRQRLLQEMVGQLGYLPHLIALEKELGQLPHLQQRGASCPKRRIDLLVFSPQSLKPLLMVECKAVPLSPTTIQQVIGYNSFVEATFIAVANDQQVMTGFYDSCEGKYRFENGLPHFKHLVEASAHH